MSLSDHLKNWSGTALRHIPASSSFDVLDFRYSGRSAENRWNEQGDPTLYLAGDEGVLIAEWGRHFVTQRSPPMQPLAVERNVYQLDLALDYVLDLRNDEVINALSLTDAPKCFADRSIARVTAGFVRRTTSAQAVLTPSMGFLDDLQRWCLVVFLEKLPPDPKAFVNSITPSGPLRWG